ncbi:unnamed protein product, partial [Mesorhabditis belari]|uniref:C-type lectin domain-containing protein n=1 Tax=Mesorhabditis belari TaxID=2138241 RepID=A0AAF3ELX1_9BILA
MTFSLLKVFFLGLSSILVVEGDCPDGSYAFTSKTSITECILPLDADAAYGTAKEICQFANGGRLIQIASLEENLYASAFSEITLGGSDFTALIGLERRADGKWTYSDGSPLIYENWIGGEAPDNGTCAALDGTSKKWVAVPGTVPYKFICTFPPKGNSLPSSILTTLGTITTTTNPTKAHTTTTTTRPPTRGCPSGWVNFTDHCYYFYNRLVSDKSFAIDFISAETQCQKLGGSQSHLVSIHSDAEYNFLNANIKTDDVPCVNGRAFIGLSCSNGSYKWTDSSSVNYNKAHTCFNDQSAVYAIINDSGCQNANDYWLEDYANSSIKQQRFICKMPM